MAKLSSVFPRLSLARLRRVFWAVGVVLISAVLSLTYVMHKKIAAAARDREEMVALRVFDELEREISAFLDGENARDPYDDLQATNPEVWAPFVVGYYKLEGANVRTVAADGPTSENRRRLMWAVDQLQQQGFLTSIERRNEVASPSKSAIVDVAQQGNEKSEASRAADNVTPGSKIMQSLNRAPERRMQKIAPKKPAPSTSRDQFSDYQEAF